MHNLECGVLIPIPNSPDGKPNLLRASDIRRAMEKHVGRMLKELEAMNVAGAVGHERLFEAADQC